MRRYLYLKRFMKPLVATSTSMLLIFFLTYILKFRSRLSNLSVKALAQGVFSRRLRNITLASVALTWLSNKAGVMRKRNMAPFFFSLLWALHYRFSVVETAKIRFVRTFFNTHIVEKAQLAQIPFYPLIWGYNGHTMTGLFTMLCEVEYFWVI